jgi:hypothetical protein
MTNFHPSTEVPKGSKRRMGGTIKEVSHADRFQLYSHCGSLVDSLSNLPCFSARCFFFGTVSRQEWDLANNVHEVRGLSSVVGMLTKRGRHETLRVMDSSGQNERISCNRQASRPGSSCRVGSKTFLNKGEVPISRGCGPEWSRWQWMWPHVVRSSIWF